MSRNWLLVFGLGAAAMLAAALLLAPREGSVPTIARIVPTATITIGTEQLRIARADTPGSRELGLSGITSLSDDEGMLFIFEEDGRHAFWMKDMAFSIDILWISSGGRVVFIAPSVAPETYPQAFTSDSPARYVLEVPAGFATEHGIEVGSKVVF